MNSLTKLSTILLLLVSVLIQCQPKDISKTKNKQIDSLWNAIDHALQEDDSTTYRRVVNHLYQVKVHPSQEVERILKKFAIHPKAKDENVKSSALLLEALYLFEQKKDESAFKKINEIKSRQIDLKLSALQTKATYYYLNDQWDTAMSYYLESYYRAKSEKNLPWIIQTANNIGTLYYYKNEFGIASKYYTEAMQGAQELRTDIPMLLNNIITCSLIGSDGTEAYKLFKKFQAKFKASNEYEKAIYDLNLIHIFWKINKIDSFKTHLDRLNVTHLGPAVITMRDQNLLYYYAYQKDFRSFGALFEPYKQQILANPTEYYLTWTGIVDYAMERGYNCFRIDQLKQFYAHPSDNKRYYLALSKTLYSILKKEKEALFWKTKMYENELEIKDFESMNFQNDLKNQIRIHELSQENQLIKYDNEIKSSQNKLVLVLFSASIVILVLSIISFLLYHKNKNIAIQKLQLEIKNNRSLYELSLNKKQFAERLIQTNQAMYAKLHKISQKLKSSSVGKDPDIIHIRRELLSIAELNEVMDDEFSQINTLEEIAYLNEHLKCIALFNPTEQQLLYYFINGHKTKEISRLTSLSEQHNRNTKSKEVKTIQSELNTPNNIEELSRFRNT